MSLNKDIVSAMYCLLLDIFGLFWHFVNKNNAMSKFDTKYDIKAKYRTFWILKIKILCSKLFKLSKFIFDTKFALVESCVHYIPLSVIGELFNRKTEKLLITLKQTSCIQACTEAYVQWRLDWNPFAQIYTNMHEVRFSHSFARVCGNPFSASECPNISHLFLSNKYKMGTRIHRIQKLFFIIYSSLILFFNQHK